tara:strand:+ start:959 stop:1264 length:306 start_codon:yes stop_codon:yes gene_type:complete
LNNNTSFKDDFNFKYIISKIRNQLKLFSPLFSLSNTSVNKKKYTKNNNISNSFNNKLFVKDINLIKHTSNINFLFQDQLTKLSLNLNLANEEQLFYFSTFK